MITKVKKGKGFEGLVSYNIDGVDRILIGGNMAGRSAKELSREAGQFRKLRPTLERAVAHLILSAAPEDPQLESATWCEIAETLLKDLGLQACPHVIVRHTDTAHQHIHIACLRIGPDGKTVPETNDRYKAERSVARIEKQYGLRQVNLKKNVRQSEPVFPMRRHRTSQATSPHQSTPRRKECNQTKSPNRNQHSPRICPSRLTWALI